MRGVHACVAVGAAGLMLWGLSTPVMSQSLGAGRLLTPAEVSEIDRTVFVDGRNLPAGSGSAVEGEGVYAAQCQACHGAGGEGGPADRLVGGQGTLTDPRPIKTVTSYWPYATTLFDYVQRAMPFRNPGSLSGDEIYAVVAYILAQDGVIGPTDVLNAQTLPDVEMPNRDGFVRDPRPASGPVVP